MNDETTGDVQAPPNPYGSPAVAMQVERAHQIAHEQGGSVASVRRDPATGRWWVTVLIEGEYQVLEWSEAVPVETLMRGSPFASADAAFQAIEAAVLGT